MEKKQKQMIDNLRKADKQYCECCEKAEVARQEWDLAVSRVSIVMPILSLLFKQSRAPFFKTNDVVSSLFIKISNVNI